MSPEVLCPPKDTFATNGHWALHVPNPQVKIIIFQMWEVKEAQSHHTADLGSELGTYPRDECRLCLK